MPATIRFISSAADLQSVDTLMVIGRKHSLIGRAVEHVLPESVGATTWDSMVTSARATDSPRSASTHTGSTPRRLMVGVLPERCSRHNSPSRAWAIRALVKAAGQTGPLGLVFALDDDAHAFASATAIAALPAWSGKSRQISWEVRVGLVTPQGFMADTTALADATDARRKAASWVDMPSDCMGTDDLVQLAVTEAQKLEGVHHQVIRGAKLQEQGLGGIWGVGRAGVSPPAMVVLDRKAGPDAPSMAWVGKGVVFDTGGLCLKNRNGMVGMSSDMGGAASVLAAFLAAVRLQTPWSLTAILCIADNAIGPNALKPDDVLTLFSGRTVEVNNTDAEGRLLVADGLAWAVKYRDPARMVDLATLTGAQSMATGRLHGAAMCNDAEFEDEAVRAGRACGDLLHPLPHAPELFRAEFTSAAADMRNSAKNRLNAGPSCAAQFIADHIPSYKRPWLHVDMAGPNLAAGRGTGFGVGLLLTLAGVGAPIQP